MKISRINPFVLSIAIVVIAAGIVWGTDRWNKAEYNFLPGVVVFFYSLWGACMGIDAVVSSLLRRPFDTSSLKWIFAGIWNLALGLAFATVCISQHLLPISLMCTPFLLNLLTGTVILLEICFRKRPPSPPVSTPVLPKDPV